MKLFSSLLAAALGLAIMTPVTAEAGKRRGHHRSHGHSAHRHHHSHSRHHHHRHHHHAHSRVVYRTVVVGYDCDGCPIYRRVPVRRGISFHFGF